MKDLQNKIVYKNGILRVPTENGAIIISIDDDVSNICIDLENNTTDNIGSSILVRCNEKGDALEVMTLKKSPAQLKLSNNKDILRCISKIINCDESEIFKKIFVEKTNKETIFYRLKIIKDMIFIKECNSFGEFINGIEVPLYGCTEENLLDKFTSVIVNIYDYEEAKVLSFDGIACNFTKFLNDREASIYKNRTNIIKVRYDDYSLRAEVLLNDTLIMEGNYWDFHNDCHGGAFNLIDKFSGYSQLVDIIVDKIKILNKSFKTQVTTEKHKLL